MRTRDCISWMWRASYGVRGYVAGASSVGILHVAASLTFVWICKRLIDTATSGDNENLPAYICVMAGCMVMQILLSAVEQHLLSKSDVLLKNRLRHHLFTGMMQSRWSGKDAFHSGDTLNRIMEDVRVVAESVTKSVPAVITAAVQFIAAFIFLFTLAPGLAWAIPGIMLVALLLSKSYITRMRRLTKGIRTTESGLQSHMQESLQHRLVLHTLERVPDVSDSLAQQQDTLQGQVMDKTGYSIFTKSLIQTGFSAGYAAAFLWGVFGMMSGTATFGMMTAFLQLVGQIQRPIMNLSRQLPPLINSLTSAERLVEIEAQPSEESGAPFHLEGNIGVRFEDVDFAYPDSSAKTLEGCTCDFLPGTTTALLGETGAGKSTMMRLILALLEPDKGRILMYNEMQSVPVSPQTRCNIVYVPQGNTLMSGTIRENLLLGDPSATDGQLCKALFTASAEFVYELPDGLETMCGERGSGLSEGQAQRIAIARALLRKGGILLLDEPTSALDPQTERTLISRITENLEGRTMIMVTHREATAEICGNRIHIPDGIHS